MTGTEPGPGRQADDPLGLVGTVLAGRYRVLEVLGRGGMGTVYLGEHVNIGRKTALKVLQAADHDPGSVARFVRGAQNAARIDHPNVCRVFDFGDPPDGLYFLAMEFVDGKSLFEIQQVEGVLSLERSASIVAQTAGALHAAHDLGIVHRDLKPGNIMITRAVDGSDFVKVVDFDIAKGMTQDQGPEVTTQGWVVGTPEYMSPEQFMGGALDGRSDVYSLGVILFRLLTGRFPFSASTPRDIMMERLSGNPLTLEQVSGKAFPAGVQEAIDGALRIPPEERWPTALHFARAVVEACGAPAPGSQVPLPTTPAGGTRPPAGSPPQPPSVPPTRAEPPLPATTVSPGAASAARAPAEGPGGAGRRRSARPMRVAAAVLVLAAGGVVVGWLLRPGPSPTAGADTRLDSPLEPAGTSDPEGDATQGGGTASVPSSRVADGAEEGARPPAPTDAAESAGSGEVAEAEPDPPPVTAAEARRVLTAFEDRFVELLLTGVPESVAADAVEQASRIYREFEGRGEDPVRSQAAFVLSKAHYYRGRSAEALEWAERAWELEPAESRRLWLERLRGGAPDPA